MGVEAGVMQEEANALTPTHLRRAVTVAWHRHEREQGAGDPSKQEPGSHQLG